MSRVLGLVRNANQLEAAFQAYDASRRPRAQGVVHDSLRAGKGYYLETEELGNDLQKITDEANKRLPLIWYYDLEAAAKKAQESFMALVAGSEVDGILGAGVDKGCLDTSPRLVVACATATGQQAGVARL